MLILQKGLSQLVSYADAGKIGKSVIFGQELGIEDGICIREGSAEVMMIGDDYLEPT
jgi:UDP-3-O-[3-hydroxymyristoyl] glucosamine N-acyltransferase